MGPLVPYIISNEFNLVIALLIGIGFGFILEQAGFSSTKKLVGLFYGYDFTVLRVFFTAGVTAMVGVLLFNHWGILDLELIYVNPTFLRSSIVGGLIMGAGFIIGGFCPGTSICAASIGKMDAMLFVIGSALGVFAFIESYPLIEEFYKADAWGAVTMYEQLGMSRLMFGFVLTSVALIAFYFTWKIEKRIRKTPFGTPQIWKARYAFAALVPFLAFAVILITPDSQERLENKIAKAQERGECVFHEIGADKLAYEIVHHYYQMNIIDVRSPEEYKKYHLPMAINIPSEEILDRKWESVFNQDLKKNIFYADDYKLVRLSCLRAKFIGTSTNMILTETAQEFNSMFYHPVKPNPELASKQDLNEYNFRVKAAQDMSSLNESLKNLGKPVTKKVKVAKGGCS